MPTVIRSGNKICVIGASGLLLAIARITHAAIVAGNEFFPTHITFSERFWWAVHALIHGW